MGSELGHAERVRSEQAHLQDSEPQLVKLQESLRQFTQELPIADGIAERTLMQVNHDRYAQVLHQLQGALRGKPEWTKELTKIDDQVQHMQTLFGRTTLLVAGLGGMVTTLLGTAFAFVPTRQVEHVWLFELKLAGSCVLLMGIGATFFFVNAKRAPAQTA